jgi:hypothetical protein
MFRHYIAIVKIVLFSKSEREGREVIQNSKFKGLYMFRALLADHQEEINELHLL